ncbi:MAG: hypothetical protein KJ899_06140, partial [Gammaproteobacteria bacterium]|nr:hypothetical protein [Gammaproteobacteria bacterium]
RPCGLPSYAVFVPDDDLSLAHHVRSKTGAGLFLNSFQVKRFASGNSRRIPLETDQMLFGYRPTNLPD